MLHILQFRQNQLKFLSDTAIHFCLKIGSMTAFSPENAPTCPRNGLPFKLSNISKPLLIRLSAWNWRLSRFSAIYCRFFARMLQPWLLYLMVDLISPPIYANTSLCFSSNRTFSPHDIPMLPPLATVLFFTVSFRGSISKFAERIKSGSVINRQSWCPAFWLPLQW